MFWKKIILWETKISTKQKHRSSLVQGSLRLWNPGMSSFACSWEQTEENPIISLYWWISFPSETLCFTVTWANEPSVIHCHPPWGPALKRERDILRPSHTQVFYKKDVNIGKSVFSQGKAKYGQHKVILNPALLTSGSSSLFFWAVPFHQLSFDAEIDR